MRTGYISSYPLTQLGFVTSQIASSVPFYHLKLKEGGDGTKMFHQGLPVGQLERYEVQSGWWALASTRDQNSNMLERRNIVKIIQRNIKY